MTLVRALAESRVRSLTVSTGSKEDRGQEADLFIQTSDIRPCLHIPVNVVESLVNRMALHSEELPALCRAICDRSGHPAFPAREPVLLARRASIQDLGFVPLCLRGETDPLQSPTRAAHSSAWRMSRVAKKTRFRIKNVGHWSALGLSGVNNPLAAKALLAVSSPSFGLMIGHLPLAAEHLHGRMTYTSRENCTGRASAPRFEQRERSGKTRLYSSAPFSTIYLSEYRIDGMYSSTYKYRSVHDFYCLGPDGANTIEHRTKSLQGVSFSYLMGGTQDGAHTPTSQDARLRHSSREFCISHSCKLLLWDTYCSLRLNYLLSGDAAYTCGQDPKQQTSFYLAAIPWSDRPLPGYNGENFYTDFSDKAELAKAVLVCASVLLGDSLVIYRLWIIWGRHRYIIIFPIFSLGCTFIAGFGMLYEFTQKGPRLRGYHQCGGPDSTLDPNGRGSLGNVLDLGRFDYIPHLQSDSSNQAGVGLPLDVFPSRVGRKCCTSDVLFWLVFGAITLFVKSDAAYAVYAVSDTFPAIIGIANLLIHARVGLGWSHDQTSPSK
ncbi:hypothetical protein B0H14DRAFT_3138136, partial [Mycena olivaceomarginata]